jgi:hypothetical protein
MGKTGKLKENARLVKMGGKAKYFACRSCPDVAATDGFYGDAIGSTAP